MLEKDFLSIVGSVPLHCSALIQVQHKRHSSDLNLPWTCPYAVGKYVTHAGNTLYGKWENSGRRRQKAATHKLRRTNEQLPQPFLMCSSAADGAIGYLPPSLVSSAVLKFLKLETTTENGWKCLTSIHSCRIYVSFVCIHMHLCGRDECMCVFTLYFVILEYLPAASLDAQLYPQ